MKIYTSKLKKGRIQKISNMKTVGREIKQSRKIIKKIGYKLKKREVEENSYSEMKKKKCTLKTKLWEK